MMAEVNDLGQADHNWYKLPQVNQLDSLIKNESKLPYLIAAGNLEQVKKLNPSLQELNEIFVSGLTCLHLATYNNHTDTILYLLNRGVDINVKDLNETTALHWCAFHKNTRLIQTFIDHPDIQITPDRNRIYPVHLSVLANNLPGVKLFPNCNVTDASGITPLHLAAHCGYIEIVQYLLESGADQNVTDQNSIRPIHLATASNHLDIVKLFADGEACEQDSLKRTPMHWAASLGNIEMMEVLQTSDMSQEDHWVDCMGFTPLVLATIYGHIKAVLYLLKRTKFVNFLENGYPWMILENSKSWDDVIREHVDELISCDVGYHWICAFGSGSSAKLFLSRGGKPVSKETEVNPLHTAAAFGNCEVIELCIENGVPVDIIDLNGDSPINWASAHGHIDAIETLIDHRATVKQSTLNWAATFGHISLIDYYLESGFNSNTEVHFNIREIICWAACHKQTSTIQYILKRFPDSLNSPDLFHWCVYNNLLNEVKLLLDFRSSYVDRCDSQYSRTALHWAAIQGNVEMAKLLLDHGANVNAVEDQGDLPIHFAIENDNIEVLKLLISRKADLNRAGDLGCPLCMASRDGKLTILKLLVQAGADINIAEFGRDTPLNIAMRYGHKNVVNYLIRKNARKTDFLHTTAEYGTLDELTQLLNNGMYVDEQNEYGSTPLFYAVRTESDNTAFLIERGADVNHRNSIGESPLHVAVQCQNLKAIRLLVGKGADINFKGDRDGITPLIRAASYNLDSAFQLLIELGADIELPNDVGETPLLILTVWADRLELIEMLFSLNVNVNVKDVNGKTPLHNAVMNNSTPLITMLIKKGADVNACSINGTTPLTLAVQSCFRGSLSHICILLVHGADINLDPAILLECVTPMDINYYDVILMDLLNDAGLELRKVAYPIYLNGHTRRYMNHLMRNVKSLQQMSRIALKRALGLQYCKTIRNQHLPKALKEYLLYGIECDC